jgi:hypothetical protein
MPAPKGKPPTIVVPKTTVPGYPTPLPVKQTPPAFAPTLAPKKEPSSL